MDEIAEGIRAGSAQAKKRLFNTLFDRIETRDDELTKRIPRAWAKPFFNGGMNNGSARRHKSRS